MPCPLGPRLWQGPFILSLFPTRLLMRYNNRMSKNTKIRMVSVPVKESTPIGGGQDDGIVLLYDEIERCYYRTTLSFITNCVLRKMNAMRDDIVRRQEEFEARIAEQQSAFIKDTAKVNETIISLIKNSNGGANQ